MPPLPDVYLDPAQNALLLLVRESIAGVESSFAVDALLYAAAEIVAKAVVQQASPLRAEQIVIVDSIHESFKAACNVYLEAAGFEITEVR